MIKRFWNMSVAVIGLIFFKIKYPNTQWLRPKKIGTFYSQDGQDLYLASLLFSAITKSPDKDSWIVDVGCNHPINFSNSFFFEKFFNTKVLAIDPIKEFSSLWEDKRSNAIFCSSAVGDYVGTTTLNIPVTCVEDNMFSFVDQGVNKRSDINFEKRIVKITRLKDLFVKHKIKEIILLSIDVEGFELSALRGINFDDVLIRCIVLENNSKHLYGSHDIRKFLIERNYVFHARIGHLDDVYIHGSMIRGE